MIIYVIVHIIIMKTGETRDSCNLIWLSEYKHADLRKPEPVQLPSVLVEQEFPDGEVFGIQAGGCLTAQAIAFIIVV